MHLQKIGLFTTAYDPMQGVPSAGSQPMADVVAKPAKMVRVHIQSEPRIDQDEYLSQLVHSLESPSA